LAIRAKADACDTFAVPLEGKEFLAGGSIPHLHRLVVAAAGQAFVVSAETDSVDAGRVPLEGKQFRAGGGVPHLHRPAPAPKAGESLAVWAEAQAGDTGQATLEGDRPQAGDGVTHRYRPVHAGAGEASAVGAEPHPDRTARVPLESEQFLPCGTVPHLDLPDRTGWVPDPVG